MAAIYEAPASHEQVHESAHEWEWEHPEGSHEWESAEWEHPETTHEWEAQEWEHPEATHEWEAQEWEHPQATHEWEAQEWEHPQATHEWEAQEWEHPEATHEWEAQEWEYPEATHEWENHEWEADPFFGKLRSLTGRLAKLARKVAVPLATRALAGMVPGVGALAGPALGRIAQQVLSEAESVAAEAEAEAFGGSSGEAEVGHSEHAHTAALSELLAAQAAEASNEAEAVSAIAATLPLTITIMRAGTAVRPALPVLTQATGRLATSMRRSGPQGRHLLRLMPTIHRRAIGMLTASARRGQPVTAPLAVRSLATATRSVLGSPRRVEMAATRNVLLRRRTAPPSPRRWPVYQPQRPVPFNPRRDMWGPARTRW